MQPNHPGLRSGCLFPCRIFQPSCASRETTWSLKIASRKRWMMPGHRRSPESLNGSHNSEHAFPSIKGDMATAKKLKDAVPGSRLLVFGMYPTLYEAKCMEDSSTGLHAVNGLKWAINNLVAALSSGSPLDQVKGIVWRNNGKISTNEPQDVSKNDLDDLPFPARDLLHNDSYILLPIGANLRC